MAYIKASGRQAVDVNTLDTIIAGERNEDSATLGYQVVRQEATATRADIGTTETLITASPAHLLAVIPNTGHTGDLEIRDAAAITGGSTPIFVLDLGPGEPAFLGGARFENGITVDGTDAACDVTILWRAI